MFGISLNMLVPAPTPAFDLAVDAVVDGVGATVTAGLGGVGACVGAGVGTGVGAGVGSGLGAGVGAGVIACGTPALHSGIAMVGRWSVSGVGVAASPIDVTDDPIRLVRDTVENVKRKKNVLRVPGVRPPVCVFLNVARKLSVGCAPPP